LTKYLIFAFLAFSVLLPSGAFAQLGTGSVEVDGVSYIISYDATGLENIVFDAADEPPTLIVFLSTTGVEGTLDITLDRGFLDSKATDGSDEDFLVLADGLPVFFTESAGNTERTLTISIPSGTLSVDIIGTVFGSEPQGQVPSEEPEGEVPAEEPVEEPVPAEEPQDVCGPGTVLRDGACVLDEAAVVEPEQPQAPEEPPMEETTCGPGTVLRDGLCVLDETCGPGTVLVGGQCVLDESAPAPKPTTSGRGMAFEFAVPLVAAFIIAFVIMIVLWAIGKAGRNKN